MSLFRFQLLAVCFILGSVQASEPVGVERWPLAPRSSPSSSTLFTALTASQTGLTAPNRYEDPRMWTDLYQEFAYGAIGSGVAVGDFDRDGRPDLAVARKDEPVQVYKNLGDFRFKELASSAFPWPQGSAWVQGVAWADVNNDGWLDLWVGRFGAPNLLFINRAGAFTEEAGARGLALVDATGMGSFADYDRDGWLDVFVQTNMLSATQGPDGQPDRLYRNKGDGYFEDVSQAAGLQGVTLGHAATWWDYNEDGWPDLYVANDYARADQLFRNNRDGTFTDVIHDVVPSMPYYSMGVDLGDVNNDGHIDFLATDMAASTREKDQRGMAGSRSRAQPSSTSPHEAPQLMRNALYLNTGTGRMQEAGQMAGIPATDWTWSPRLEDFDNDGRLDLIVTNGMVREYHNADLLQRLMGLESLTGSREAMKTSPLLADRDLAFKNEGDLRFTPIEERWGVTDDGVSFGSATGDFDGDGDLDLVRIRYQATPEILRNDESVNERLVLELVGRKSNRDAFGATVRLETVDGIQVRTLTSARGYLSTSEPLVYFGLGKTTEVTRLDITWPSGVHQTFKGLAAGHRYRIQEPDTSTAAANAGPGARTTLFHLEATDVEVIDRRQILTNAQSLLPWDFQSRGPALAVGRSPGSEAFWVVGGTTQTPARVVRGNEILFTFPLSPELDDGPLALLDVEGDGDLDVLRTRIGAQSPAGSPHYRPQLWINDGRERFTLAPAESLPDYRHSVGALVVADWNLDGRPDLLLGSRNLPGRYPLSGVSELWLNQGGTFLSAPPTLCPPLRDIGLVTSALASDANGDGRLDLIVATEWGLVHLLTQEADGNWQDSTEASGFASAGSGAWTSVTGADFNHDGRIDYAVGNLGLNTTYQGTRTSPDRAYFGDLRGGGSPFLLETLMEGGVEYPRRTRQDLSTRLPQILKAFPRNDDYARAPLDQVVPAARLKTAKLWRIEETRSGTLLSQADGTWSFAPWPRLAQLAPTQGMVATDLNADGHTDLVLLQNSDSPLGHLGRFTGGLGQVLLGDGRGEFSAQPVSTSGWSVPGDGKALVVIDEKTPETKLLYAVNNGPVGRGVSTPDRATLKVVVEPAGSLSLAGTRLTFQQPGLPPQTAEMYLGNGYMSQGDTVVIFGRGEKPAAGVLTVQGPGRETSTYPVAAEARRLELRL